MMMITRDEGHLSYSDSGAGSPPLLFVHGWAGDRSDFAPQIEAFRARHRVVALERRGHGESSARPPRWTIVDDADDIAWACGALGLHKPVLVVHSQGGLGLEVAARYPELLSGVILLDAPVFPPAEMEAHFRGAADGLASPGWQDTVRYLADACAFIPTDDAGTKARILDRMIRAGQPLLRDSWRAFLDHDVAAAAAGCKVPLLLVGSIMPSDHARLRALCPQVQIGQTVGAGHFHQLLVPDQVNAMIARFMQ
jgi:pimeloyl-ACP methyl ester carboxylesterase